MTTNEAYLKILEAQNAPQHIKRHCLAVGSAAERICSALEKAGVKGLDPAAVQTAGHLHDIARAGRDHDIKGAALLHDIDFSEFGLDIDETTRINIEEIVSNHMRLSLPDRLSDIDSAAVVALADRTVKEGIFVGYEARMDDLVIRYADVPDVIERVYMNMERTLSLIKEIEAVTGRSLEDIVTGGRVETESLLRLVERPGRYIGGEIGSVQKDWETVAFRFCFAFPDLYEIGMSYTGMQILYGLINARDDALCERVFAPAEDLAALLKGRGLPLFSLENKMPLKMFDIIGFTLQYELCYTNIVRMLGQADISLYASERGDNDPIIIAGGPCCANAEPVAPFFDLICVGDGEEILPALADAYIGLTSVGRENFIRAASRIPGVYAPSFYEPVYVSKTGDKNVFSHFDKKYEDLPDRITRAKTNDLDTAFFPVNPVVPHVESVHDRISVEIMRGCYRKCLFCQAGYACDGVRKRSPQRVKELVLQGLANTGYDEATLLSLSTGDYPGIEALVTELMDELACVNATLSMPSLRLDSLKEDTLKKIAEYKRSGLTFAPEAGTQRLRDHIGKQITEEDILKTLDICLPLGFTKYKFYFMIGLPGEEYEDLDGIVSLAANVVKHAKIFFLETEEKFRFNLSVSVSNFVPKPGTPLELTRGDSEEELIAKVRYLKDAVRKVKGVAFKYHDTRMSRIEMLLSKGDRRVSEVIRLAAERGSGFDSWREHFSYENWLTAFAAAGMPPEDLYYDDGAGRLLPWSLIKRGKAYG